ncbi:uncharacterized protein V1518DRAFT_372822 [Limtongia smithiae]|uniref:uncharacterized protein n=1 Tax=Limtongia smithiae TaxID=1125753 RepID=UPI0034CDCB09
MGDTPAAARSGGSVQLALFLGDPFALATVSVAVIGWIIALGASVAADVETTYPQFSWWGIAYQFVLILAVTFVFSTPAGADAYAGAVVGLTATALVYSTNSTNNLVYTGIAAEAAAAAGNILLSIINILWIVYFGTGADAVPRAFIDSYSLRNSNPYRTGGASARNSNANSNNGHITISGPMAVQHAGGAFMQPGAVMRTYPTTASGGAYTQSSQSQAGPQMYTSAQLGGFETATPTPYSASSLRHSMPPGPDSATSAAVAAAADTFLDAPTEYPLRARAIYPYDANPEDINELSFLKNEILEVSDTSGRWWQARRANGEVGICPSNYVQLLE